MRRMLFVGLIVLMGCSGAGFSGSDALALCDNAIKSTSINPSAVEIPFREGRERGGIYTFVWLKGGDGVLMPNQFGAQVETEMLCRVDEQTERVVELTINGRTLSAK